MALFRSARLSGSGSRSSSRRVIIVEQPSGRLPDFFTRLRITCSNLRAHALPVVADFHKHGVHHDGQPTVIYRCPLCSSWQGFVRDWNTGRPRRLWRRDP